MSLCSFAGPMVSGELVKSIGFEWVMRVAGLCCIFYCPVLVYLALERSKNTKEKIMTEDFGARKEYNSLDKVANHRQLKRYQRFYDNDDDL